MRRMIPLLFVVALAIAQCPEDKYCLSCNGSICEVCIYSYFDNGSNKCVHTKTIDHCTHYSDADTCLSCAPRYYLNDNKCLPIEIENCIIGQKVVRNVSGQNISTVVCLACADNILIKDGECNKTSQCQQPNCKVCSIEQQSEVCIRCQEGFVLDPTDGECVEQITKGCLALDDKDTVSCAECIPGYYSSADDKCTITEIYDSSKDFDTKPTGGTTVTENDEGDNNNEGKDIERTAITLMSLLFILGVLFH